MNKTLYWAEWPDGLLLIVTVRRRWFPWLSTNVTFGRTVFEGGIVGMNDPTTRHEFTHVRQYVERGWWWVLTHPRQREAEARAAERSHYPMVSDR